MSSQTTSDLWVQLCLDLQAQQDACAAGERAAVVRRFLESARQLFQNPSVRLRDAAEIAGDCLLSLGISEDAKACFEEALSRSEGALDARARIATKLAMLLDSEGKDLPGTEAAYRTAVECYATVDTSQLPTLLNNLAGIQIRLGKIKEAEATYDRAIHLARKLSGSSSTEVALLLSNLAVAHTKSGNYAKAESLHLQALSIREANFGSNHPDVAASMANIGVVYHDKGQFLKAEKFYSSALAILKHFREPTDPEVRWVRSNYERLPHISVRALSNTERM